MRAQPSGSCSPGATPGHVEEAGILTQALFGPPVAHVAAVGLAAEPFRSDPGTSSAHLVGKSRGPVRVGQFVSGVCWGQRPSKLEPDARARPRSSCASPPLRSPRAPVPHPEPSAPALELAASAIARRVCQPCGTRSGNGPGVPPSRRALAGVHLPLLPARPPLGNAGAWPGLLGSARSPRPLRSLLVLARGATAGLRSQRDDTLARDFFRSC